LIFLLEGQSISKFPPKYPPNRQAAKGPQILTPDIRAAEVRLIDGERNEVVSRQEAERLAKEQGLDLVIMSFDSSPLVVRLIDYGKFKFENEKKAREAKKKQHVVEIKEIKMGVRIDDHDYETKMHRAQKFLEQGNKVKCTIRLKGRETQHANLAFDLGRKFVADLQEVGSMDGDIRMEGRTITINISPKKK
jgi:translation initiation factor IF-3